MYDKYDKFDVNGYCGTLYNYSAHCNIHIHYKTNTGSGIETDIILVEKAKQD